MLKQAIEAAGSMEPAALQKALSEVSYKGVGGAISFDKTGQAKRPLGTTQPTVPVTNSSTVAVTLRGHTHMLIGAVVATPARQCLD